MKYGWKRFVPPATILSSSEYIISASGSFSKSFAHSKSASGANISSWSAKTIKSPVAISIAAFVFAEIPWFSSKTLNLILLSSARYFSIILIVSLSSPDLYSLASTIQSSQSEYVCAFIESIIALRYSALVLYTGTTILNL